MGSNMAFYSFCENIKSVFKFISKSDFFHKEYIFNDHFEYKLNLTYVQL